MYVLHGFWEFDKGKDNSFLHVPIQPSCRTTKELHVKNRSLTDSSIFIFSIKFIIQLTVNKFAIGWIN